MKTSERRNLTYLDFLKGIATTATYLLQDMTTALDLLAEIAPEAVMTTDGARTAKPKGKRAHGHLADASAI